MAAGTYALTIERGVTLAQQFTWKDNGGSPINLTGYAARCELRQSVGGTLYKRLTSDNGGLTLGGAAGTIVMNLSPANTRAFPASSGVYSLVLVSATGVTTRLLEGAFTVTDEVTEDT